MKIKVLRGVLMVAVGFFWCLNALAQDHHETHAHATEDSTHHTSGCGIEAHHVVTEYNPGGISSYR
jgi:hypothetical protein